MKLTVNGEQRDYTVPARTHLADLLREHFGLTGTHLGCEQGVCGACTVLVDGAPARACLLYAHEAAGHDVTTIEGLDHDPTAAALRAAFTKHHALQCGYCTPGMMMTARDIVLRLGAVDETRIREELAGNLCRCTGYRGIVRATAEVALAVPTRATSSRPITMVGLDPAISPPPTPLPPQMPGSNPGKTGDADLPNRIAQSQPIALPLAQAWAILSDPTRAAACLPGASLSRHEGEAVEGTLAVALGPITARLAGVGTLVLDHAAHAAMLSGRGQDGATAARGQVDWRLEPAPEGCILHLELAWRLTGPLAQFSRPALLRGLVRAIAADFAENLARAGRGETVAPRASVFRLLRLWLKSLFSR